MNASGFLLLYGRLSRDAILVIEILVFEMVRV
jgi:hypothetical protein